MRRYDAVLLDVDGTLVDSNDAHAHSWVETFAKHGIEVAFSRVRKLIGMGGDRLIETITGLPRDSRESKRISEERSEDFREHWLSQVKPLAGSRELVLRLRSEGYQYAIASAARAEELEPLLRIAGLSDLVSVRTTSSDIEKSKPDPEIVDATLARLAAPRSRTVMLGDTPYDVEAARAARIEIIGFTSGGWSAEALAGAVAVFRGPADLLARWNESPLAS
ncbi:MAG: Phosphorylated carbohydrates phosphatase [Myxococcales bacterium]|nr:Phosphorylated carbohydrates phosphatase [Myxococcales bacterium]